MGLRGKNLKRRLWRWRLFKCLVQSVISYGVEIWGWEEKEELEKILLDYIRWIFKLDFCTPRYIISRELGIEKLKIRWGIRARRYEEKIKEKDDGSWVKVCWEEKRSGNWRDKYGRERERYYNRNGWEVSVIDRLANEDRGFEKELIDRDRKVDWQIEERKIREAKYNRKYKELKGEGESPRYLRKKFIDKTRIGVGIRALARLRCGNMEEDNKYWLEENEKACLFCGNGRDRMDHLLEECRITKEWFRKLGRSEEERARKLWSDELDEEEVLRKFWKERKNKWKEKRGEMGRVF